MDRDSVDRNLNVFIILLFVISALILVRPLALLTSHIPLSYNEGWNAYLADVAVNGKTSSVLYPDRYSSVTNNYPPLSFLVVGFVGRITGRAVVAGRMINLISILFCAVFVYGITRKLTNAGRPSAIAALSFFIYSATVFWQYFAIDDPQWMAEACMLSGFYVCLYDPDRLRNVVLASFLMVCAGFVKHNEIAIPLSTGLYLFIRNRQTFYGFILSFICFLTLFFLFSYLRYGFNFFTDVIENKRIISTSGVLGTGRKLIEIFPLVFSMYAVAKTKKFSRPEKILVISFSITSFAFGATQSLAEGVNYNCFFDFFIVGSLALGIFLATKTQTSLRDGREFLEIAFAVFFVFVFAVPVEMVRSYETLSHFRSTDAFYQKLVGDIRKTRGDVACQDLALCYWAGKREVMDFFNTEQKLEIYGRDHLLLSQIRPNSVPMIEMSNERHSSRLETYFKELGYRRSDFGRGVFFFEK